MLPVFKHSSQPHADGVTSLRALACVHFPTMTATLGAARSLQHAPAFRFSFTMKQAATEPAQCFVLSL